MILNIIFFPAWFSIFASEMAKVMTLVCYKGWKWQKRVRACISSIFLLNHGILLHRQQRIEMRKREVLGGADSGYEEELMEIQRQSQENASLKSIIRGYIYDVCWNLESWTPLSCLHFVLIVYSRIHATCISSSSFWVQSNPLNGSASGPAKYWTNKQIEPLTTTFYYVSTKMGPPKTWTNNRIEPLSGDPLSGLDCKAIVSDG